MNRIQSLSERLVKMSDYLTDRPDPVSHTDAEKVDKAAAALVKQAAVDLQVISELAGRVVFVIGTEHSKVGPEMRANMQYTELKKYLKREV